MEIISARRTDLLPQAYKRCESAKLTDEGTSGSYLMCDQDQQPIGIFKPVDEECNAPNNPRGYQGEFGSQTLRAGVRSGEATIREVAAYLLDYDGFSGVPETSLV